MEPTSHSLNDRERQKTEHFRSLWSGHPARLPVLYFFLSVCMGILTAVPLPVVNGIFLFVFPIAIFLARYLLHIKFHFLLIFLILFSFNHFSTEYRISRSSSNCVSRYFYPSPQRPLPDPVRIIGFIARSPRITSDGLTLTVKTDKITWRKKTLKCQALVSVFIPYSGATYAHEPETTGLFPVPIDQVLKQLKTFGYGDTVEILGYWRPLSLFRNGGLSRIISAPFLMSVHGKLKIRQPEFIHVSHSSSSFLRSIERSRLFLLEKVFSLPSQTGPNGTGLAFLSALWFGEKHLLPLEHRRALSSFGLSHILAVSGLHVGLLAFFLWWFLFKLLPLPRTLAYALLAGSIVWYMTLTGFQTSVLRAGFIFLLYLFARWAFIPVQPLNLLLFLATIWLCIEPFALFRPGFQMTFGITGFLILSLSLVHRNRMALSSLARKCIDGWNVSILAFCASLFWQTWLYGYIPLFSPFSNLVAWPILVFLILTGFFLPVLIFIPFGKDILLFLTHMTENLLNTMTQVERYIPGVITPTGLIGPVIVTFILMLFFVFLKRPGRSRIWAVTGLYPLIIFGLVAGFSIATHFKPEAYRLMVFDVNQGESMALAYKNEAILIDTGGLHGAQWDIGNHVVRPSLLHHGITRIHAIIMSHAHRDHAGGVVSLARFFRIDRIYYPAGSPVPAPIKTVARDLRIQLMPLKAGDVFSWKDWRFLVLNPPETYFDTNSNLNEGSLAVQARLHTASILFAGDTEREAETFMVRTWGERLRSGLLKLGHHGSKTSSNPFFLDKVKPRLAVCSAGLHNRYRVPSPEVVRTLLNRHVPVFCTKKYGEVILTFSQASCLVEIQTFFFKRPLLRNLCKET